MLRSDTVVLGVRERNSEDRSEVNRKRVKVRHRQTILTLPEVEERFSHVGVGDKGMAGGRKREREMRRRRETRRGVVLLVAAMSSH